MTPEELRAFEEEIRLLYEAGKILAPVHLSGGNEEQLIEIFERVDTQDWVFSTHRSHYHALLKGVPPGRLKSEILAGHSICLNFPDHRFYTSAIVGGILPIATGVAMGIKRAGGREVVWAFVGEMAAETGMFYECTKYAAGHDLPIMFVVEDNGLSVNSPTRELWPPGAPPRLIHYTYTRVYPHHGSGVWVNF